ncbi:DUF3841 domain-containing protein [Paenibacillus jilunlii]|uniref:DUF3841 domain-containing protein n=1 Tax=Paenibacillus jilunlii TaxID=682956 RepID=A0A1G9WGK4_9BACL|nr:DUF3841 domain-containing protein [Paenibacillus jilunlii]KWX73525.1 hypothetical protein AML91_17750 [Paenibacillus jilunlii]SDM83668.1 protein of unknown function [Paenibacillus jilunlii]
MARYWTNQTIEAWKKAQDIGYLVGNSDFIWGEMLRDYHWMMSQMKKRIPNYLGEFPIWLWTEKPDLRRSGHFNGGTHAVSLEVEIPSEQVLLSDFDAWHCVLNDSFLALDEAEWEAFYRNELKMSKEESWERIFNLELLRESPWWNSEPHLQGVSGKIKISHVCNVREFIARGMKI